MERYENAAHFYDVSLALEDDALTRALYADALMFSGKYEEARQSFETYLQQTSRVVAEYRLKAYVLPLLIDNFGLSQQRRPEIAMGLAEINQEVDEGDVPERFSNALEADALCALAWFNRGVLLSGADQRTDAMFSFLMAGLAQSGDVEAWNNALGLALSAGDEYLELSSVILEAAFRLNGAAFMDRMKAHTYNQPAGFPVAEYLEAIEEILAQLPVEDERALVRFLGEGSDYEEFNLGRSALEED